MPSILKRTKSHTHVGLQIEPGRASAVAVDRKRVVAAHSLELASGAVTDTGIPDPAAVAGSLRQLFDEAGLERRAYLGLPIQHGVVRLLDMPLIEDEAERDTAVRFQAAEAIAMPLEEAILDYAYIGQTVSPGSGARMQIVLAAARRGPVQELVTTVQAAGIKPLGLEFEPFALVRALGGQAAETEPARLYCHLGATAVLAIAVGQACLFTRSAPGAGPGLVEQVRMLLGYYASQPGSDGVSEVVVSGAGPEGSTSLDALGVPEEIPVRFAAPLGPLEVSGGAGEDHRRMTLAAGLALGGFA